VIPESLSARVAAAGTILITSHANPDGDAIGSELGLAAALEAAGKRVTVWNADPTPPGYSRLPGADRIHVGAAPPAGFPAGFALAIVLECPTLDRSGLGDRLVELPIVNIDHHLGNSGYGVENWIEPQRAAVALLVAELVEAIDAPLPVEAANCLLVGLRTDTGGFRFANADPDAFRGAARLVERGARVEQVAQWLDESRSEGSIRLLGEMLATLERHAAGRVASVHVRLEMFERAGATVGDSESLVDVPRTIDGVQAVVLLRELAEDDWKISLRSRGAVDVEAIARRHGGGGHRNAAGCRFEGTLDRACDRFVAELERAIEEAS
jgi:phosphoesterase RecJ-like protein